MRLLIITAIAAAIFWGSGPALADDRAGPDDLQGRAEQALREGAGRIAEAFELLLRSIPRYAIPEILENGDIIMLRKRVRPYRQPERTDEPVETSA